MIRRTIAALTVALLGLGLAACTSPAMGEIVRPSSDPTVEPSTDRTTVVYRTVDDESLSASVCLPDDAETARPAMILVHGGGFTEGSRTSMHELCQKFADQGIVGVSIDYRLLPDNPYPAPVDDAVAAVEWLSDPAIAAGYGVDPARIGMLGSSAGAIIAATVATRDDSALKVAVALSPVSDMSPAGLALGDPTPAAIQSILGYLGCSSIEECPQGEEASPLLSVSADDAPMFLAGGTRELVPQAQVQALHDALLAEGVPSEIETLAGTRHGLALLTDEVLAHLFDFVKEHLAS